MERRKFIKSLSASTSLVVLPDISINKKYGQVLEISGVRKKVLRHLDLIMDKNGPYGSYRQGTGKRPDLYSSCDVAIMRAIMGEDLKVILSDQQNQEWIDHINSFANSFHGQPTDGSYGDTYGHSIYHTNGMVIGALGVLKGKQKYPVKLYDAFNNIESVGPWLEQIDWVNQWSASHLFWGGMHCYSMSSKCEDQWKNEVFRWLNNNVDEFSGWWRKGIPHADRHQPLGGSVHILPIYQHLEEPFPYPEEVINSVLDLQLPNYRWLEANSVHVMSYLDMDALYALRYMSELVPDHRKNDIDQAVHNYSNLVMSYWKKYADELLKLHPHIILAAVSTFGLLQQFNPDRFVDTVSWTDIFSDDRFYQTSKVEVFL